MTLEEDAEIVSERKGMLYWNVRVLIIIVSPLDFKMMSFQ